MIAEVEEKADELVRAAEALYLDGLQFIPDGYFHYSIIRRQERIYVLRITYLGG
ncbi:hypothetical protein [Streptacidiphilus sp. EB103A]|uniref:hypothetical protein n=1 Tax=Streptacidiphilus sp. EB103A TaxID=3156275 RepID=UPI00351803E6